MNEAEEFLKSLTEKQLETLKYLLENDMEGDIDYLIFKIESELKEK